MSIRLIDEISNYSSPSILKILVKPKEYIEILPSQIIKKFQKNLVYHIHRKLAKNNIQEKRKIVSLPCIRS
ncbi:17231_t:CDS:2 [Funneliformis geosporum]|uniref:17231_t:CDS:1 n=1 Tax=Funneliformis geosporum TaxID=1117311 RepID=A0A9W4WP78_9GLOM|nr:17231_t:CDS:2 [Funneliformis geosporum]